MQATGTAAGYQADHHPGKDTTVYAQVYTQQLGTETHPV